MTDPMVDLGFALAAIVGWCAVFVCMLLESRSKKE